jgi:hypothetical protein
VLGDRRAPRRAHRGGIVRHGPKSGPITSGR